MRLLKVVEEYRAESEQEVKEMNEQFKAEARTNGYDLSAFSYSKKEKKKNKEVVDDGYLVKVAKVYGGFWDGLE
jgi:hypothetical protein